MRANAWVDNAYYNNLNYKQGDAMDRASHSIDGLIHRLHQKQ